MTVDRDTNCFNYVKLILPFLLVEAGRLADTGFSVDLRNRRNIFALFDDGRLLHVSKIRWLHHFLFLFQPNTLMWKTLTQIEDISRKHIRRFNMKIDDQFSYSATPNRLLKKYFDESFAQ